MVAAHRFARARFAEARIGDDRAALGEEELPAELEAGGDLRFELGRGPAETGAIEEARR